MKKSILHNLVENGLEIAKKSTLRVKMAAIICNNKGQILTFSENMKIMGMSDKDKFSIHAEEAALMKAIKLNLFNRVGRSKLNLLVVRYKVSRKGPSLSKPCPRCQYLIKEAGIRTYYMDDEKNILQLKG